MNKIENFFFDEVLKQDMISGFPYPERECALCKSTLRLARVAHVQDAPEHFKALYLCVHPECEGYDGGQTRYTRVYFSSQQAYDKLSGLQMALPRKRTNATSRRN